MATGIIEREVIVIKPIDAEAISVRLQRDGVVTTYTLPPLVDGVTPPAATLDQARYYCATARETAENRLRADPDNRLFAHELAIFAGLVRLIEACTSSDIIKVELRRIARQRAVDERAAVQAEAVADSDVETGDAA